MTGSRIEPLSSRRHPAASEVYHSCNLLELKCLQLYHTKSALSLSSFNQDNKQESISVLQHMSNVISAQPFKVARNPPHSFSTEQTTSCSMCECLKENFESESANETS